MLSNKDLSLLAAKLNIPLVVGAILDKTQILDRDTHYALHDTISDMQPDSALLAIALAGNSLSAAHIKASPSIKILAMECDRIVSEYGPLWLQNAQSEDTVDEERALESLTHIAEDLESLTELLTLAAEYLRLKDRDAAAIATILALQAEAQAVIAECFLDALGAMPQEPLEGRLVPHIAAELTGTGNIVQFPLRRG